MSSTVLGAPGAVRHPYWILAAVCLLGLMSTIGVSMPYPILAPIFVGGPVDGFTHFADMQPSVLMGIALAANPLGILIGSLVAGPLSDRHGRRLVLAVTLIATLAGHLLTAWALVLRNYPLFTLARFCTGLVESNTAVARAMVADLHEQIDRTLGLIFGLQLAYTLALTSLYEFSPLWMLQNAHFDSRGIAFVTAGQCAAMTLTSVLAGRFGSAGGHPLRRAAVYALVAAVCLCLMAVLPGRLGIFVIMAMGVPTAMYNAVMPAWMSERFAEHGQGRIMGLLSTIFCVANVIVALGGGWIALLSTRWIMALGGAAAVLSATLMLRLARTEAGPHAWSPPG